MNDMKDYWNLNLVDEHRRGISDIDWASQQDQEPPNYVIGDVVEFKVGGFEIIVTVNKPHDGWPSSYAADSIKGFPRPNKHAWHYEGDIKRLVKGSAIRSLNEV